MLPEHRFSSHPGAYRHCQGLPGVLIQHREHLVAAPIAELVVYEVYCPDVVWMGWSQPDDGTVLVVKPSSLLVSLWKLYSFLTPEPLDLLVIDPPALDVKQFQYSGSSKRVSLNAA